MTLAAEPHPAPPQQPTVAWSEPDVDRRVEFWPTVAIRSALESGDIATWQRIAAALKRDPLRADSTPSRRSPRGHTGDRHRQRLWEVLDRARTHLDANERAEVARQVGLLLDRSGLQRQEFASRIGVTAQDLTAYLDGIVSPSASLMIRMRRLSDRFVRAKSVRAADS